MIAACMKCHLVMHDCMQHECSCMPYVYTLHIYAQVNAVLLTISLVSLAKSQCGRMSVTSMNDEKKQMYMEVGKWVQHIYYIIYISIVLLVLMHIIHYSRIHVILHVYMPPL